MKQLIKSLGVLCVLLISTGVQAGVIDEMNTLDGSNIIKGQVLRVRSSLIPNGPNNFSGDLQYQNFVTLTYGREEHSDVEGNIWSLEVSYEIYAGSNTETGIVKIDANGANPIYIDKVKHNVGGDVFLKVLDIQKTGNVPADVHLQLLVQTSYGNDFISAPKLSFDAVNHQVEWQAVAGADEYELEWTFIDRQAMSSDIVSLQEALKVLTEYLLVNTNKEPLSITTTNNFFQLPHHYSQGAILFRVRGIGHYNSGLHSDYTYSDWGYVNENGTYEFLIIDETEGIDPFEEKKNWQVVTSYAEDGKFKKVISYMDGSYRNRQIQTNLSTDQTVIAAETKYDYEGRPVMNILPVPLGKADLNYENNLNTFVSTSGAEKEQFDTLNPAKLSTSSGASQYYSGDNLTIKNNQSIGGYNMIDQTHMDYIPDAKGHPYTLVQFDRDALGKPIRQSGLGEEFKLHAGAGDAHFTQYYYGAPSATELHRLFGSNVGNAKHYRKETTIDPNGQASVSYLDQEGRVIATALTGASPDNLNELAGAEKKYQTIALETGTLDVDNDEVFSTNKILNLVPTSYTFKYDFTGVVNQLDDVCKECVYDMVIDIKDPDGTSITGYPKSQTFSQGDQATINCPDVDGNAYSFIFGGPIPFTEIGEYLVTKSLRLASGELDNLKKVITAVGGGTGAPDKQAILQKHLTGIVEGDCDFSCEGYCTQENTNEHGVFDQIGYEACLVDECSLNAVIDELAEDVCNGMRDQMINQISPYIGDYSKKQPVEKSYYNEKSDIYKDKEIYDENGDKIVYTFDDGENGIFNTSVWQQDWAEALVPEIKYQDGLDVSPYTSIHPEYCHYKECIANIPFNKYDIEMSAVDSWLEAKEKGFLNPLMIDFDNWFFSQSADFGLGKMDPYWATVEDIQLTVYDPTRHNPNEYNIDWGNSRLTTKILSAATSDDLGTFWVRTPRQVIEYRIEQYIKESGVDLNGNGSTNDDLSLYEFVALPHLHPDGVTYNKQWDLFMGLYKSLKDQIKDLVGRKSGTCDYLNEEYAVVRKISSVTPTDVTGLNTFLADNKDKTYGCDGLCATTAEQTAHVLRTECNAAISAVHYQDIVSNLEQICLGSCGEKNPYGILLSSDIDPNSPEINNIQALIPGCDVVDVLGGASQDIDDVYECTHDLDKQGATDLFNDMIGFFKQEANMLVEVDHTHPKYTEWVTEMNDLGLRHFYGFNDPNNTVSFYYDWDGTGDIHIKSTYYNNPTTVTDYSVFRADIHNVSEVRVIKMNGDYGDEFRTFATDLLLNGQVIEKKDLINFHFTKVCKPTPISTCGCMTDILANVEIENKTVDECRQESYEDIKNAINYAVGQFKTSTNTTGLFVSLIGKNVPDDIKVGDYDLEARWNWVEALVLFDDGSLTVMSHSAVEGWRTNGGFSYTNLFGNHAKLDEVGEVVRIYDGESLSVLVDYINHEGVLITTEVGALSQVTACPTQSVYNIRAYQEDYLGGIKVTLNEAIQKMAVAYQADATKEYFVSFDQNRDATTIENVSSNVVNLGTIAGPEYAWYTSTPNTLSNSAVKEDVVGLVFKNSILSLVREAEGTTTLVNTGPAILPTHHVLDIVLEKIAQNPGGIIGEYYTDASDISYALVYADVPIEGDLQSTNCAKSKYKQVDLAAGNITVKDVNGADTKVYFYDETGTQLEISKITYLQAPEFGIELPDGYAMPTYSYLDKAVSLGYKYSTGEEDITAYMFSDKPDAVLFKDCFMDVNIADIQDDAKQQCIYGLKASAELKAADEYNNAVTKYLNHWLAEHANKCFETPFKETFSVSYEKQEHHYTLYYYDQAGSLVQTVPPEGVHPLGEGHFNEGVYQGGEPTHLMKTRYQYNSLGELVYQATPDGGISTFHYDHLGRMRFSQNAKQAANSITENEAIYSYTTYDNLSRTVEAGEMHKAAWTMNDADLNNPSFPTWAEAEVVDVTHTYYNAAPTAYANLLGENTRNRVAGVSRFNSESDNAPATSAYSYDVHGNVKELEQIIPGIGHKYTTYSYDLISGNVNEVTYQEGKQDQFIHRYTYDADNRIVNVKTSQDGLIWHEDAHYYFYKHGPLARTEIGEDIVQGCDNYYTINGWIKGMNLPHRPGVNLRSRMDVADDGLSGGNLWVAQDEFAFGLGYFKGDYKMIGSDYLNAVNATPLFAESGGQAGNAADQTKILGQGLYNGNIATMVTENRSIGGKRDLTGAAAQDLAVQKMTYQYDQLQRIVHASSYNNVADNGLFGTAGNGLYNTSYSYDANGNLETLSRTNKDGLMDELSYHYTETSLGRGNNQLLWVADAAGKTTDHDLGTQLAGNYEYDAIGQLTADEAEGIERIEWDVYNKIKAIHKKEYTDPDIFFAYDAMGNRIMKQVRPKKTNGEYDNNYNWITTYYSRDASGNVLATYKQQQKPQVQGTELRLSELNIYGSNRVGMLQPDIVMNGVNSNQDYTQAQTKPTERVYELSNHLGNVYAVVTGLKEGVDEDNNAHADYYEADVMSLTEYYPFGMEIAERSYSSPSYRYGFNGMEKDDEVKGSGNSYTAMYWQYDSRLGRRWNLDPVKIPSISRYATFSDNPIIYKDPDGDNPFLGFLIGAAAEYAGQVVGNMTTAAINGEDVFSTNNFTNVDIADIIISGVEGAITVGTSATKSFTKAVIKKGVKRAVKIAVRQTVGKKVAKKVAKIVAIEAAKAIVDVHTNGNDVEVKVTHDIEEVATKTAIGTVSAVVSDILPTPKTKVFKAPSTKEAVKKAREAGSELTTEVRLEVEVEAILKQVTIDKQNEQVNKIGSKIIEDAVKAPIESKVKTKKKNKSIFKFSLRSHRKRHGHDKNGLAKKK